jgi:glycosyltransferase involved in cell wall biosynthesis
MAEVKISIIVPIYNDEKYLGACLDSLLAQTLGEIEIICTIDGATDRSSEILEAYRVKDSRIIALRQERSGPGPARNAALEKARGTYILFCDADDSLEPDAAEYCYDAMSRNPCDLIVFNTTIIEDGRSVAGLKNSEGEYISLVNSENAGSLNKTECVKIMQFATVWGKMFRADLIRRYRIRFSRNMVGEDARFLLSYLMITNSGFALNRSFYRYYLRQKAELFHAAHPWLGRVLRFPGIFFSVFTFTLINGMPFRIYYFFLWLFTFFKSRKIKRKGA